jgi:hypothetical protein
VRPLPLPSPHFALSLPCSPYFLPQPTHTRHLAFLVDKATWRVRGRLAVEEMYENVNAGCSASFDFVALVSCVLEEGGILLLAGSHAEWWCRYRHNRYLPQLIPAATARTGGRRGVDRGRRAGHEQCGHDRWVLIQRCWETVWVWVWERGGEREEQCRPPPLPHPA